jgi:FkbM family methyltransferase
MQNMFRVLKFIANHPLNKKKKAQALLRFLRWQIGSRLVPGEIVYPWIHGVKFFVRPGETGLTQNIYCGLQEFEDMAYVLHVLDADDIFVDVGSNAGSYTLLACGVKGANGYCFEPSPATFERLVRNLKLNDLSTKVKTYNNGIADKEGSLLFTAGLDTMNHVVAQGEEQADTMRVQVFPLDHFLETVHPSVIKIDVEGLETLVVQGMRGTLGKDSLHSVIMELNGSGLRYGFSEADIIKTMREFGFRMFHYQPFTRALEPVTETQTQKGNILFLRNDDWIRDRLARAAVINVGGMEI